MANFKLVGVDIRYSSRTESGQTILFKLSDIPPGEWIQDFNKYASANPALRTSTVNLPIANNMITVISGVPIPPKEIQDALNEVIAEANRTDDEFEKQLDDLKF